MLDAFLPSFPSKYIRDNIRYLGVQFFCFSFGISLSYLVFQPRTEQQDVRSTSHGVG